MNTLDIRTTQRVGQLAAVGVLVLLVMYPVALALGFMSLETPDQPIGNPIFSILEVLIIAMMPAMVLLMISVHAWAPEHMKIFSATSVVFMASLACITCSLHFVILTLSQQPQFQELSSSKLLFSFEWPSVAYALDILAWDFFFALSMLFAAPVFFGNPIANAIRWLMWLSGGLALLGLGGVVYGNMQLRNIGILGYLGVFTIVVGLLAVLFGRNDNEKTERQPFCESSTP